MISRLVLFAVFCLLPLTSLRAAVKLGIDVLAEQGFAPLQGKRVGLVTNQTGVNADGTRTRVVLKKNVNLVALYSPEHGIDGTIGAGKYVSSRRDSVTGLPVFSLYGPTRRPTGEMLSGIDVLVYDMQDIGVRSYTYISCMVKCMEACGAAGIPFVVLDRPNPLGGVRVEGPPIEDKWRSYVGQIPVQYLHGMTCGELAQMTNAKGWAESRCKLTVIPMRGWSRDMLWPATGLRWVQTSPNIPTFNSVPYYAATSIIGSLDGAGLDVGIGEEPFQMLGHSALDASAFTARMKSSGLSGVRFTPYTRKDFEGTRLTVSPATTPNLAAINIYLLAEANRSIRPTLFARYRDADNIFYKIYGSTSIRAQIERGTSADDIVAGWSRSAASFAADRKSYLLY